MKMELKSDVQGNVYFNEFLYGVFSVAYQE